MVLFFVKLYAGAHTYQGVATLAPKGATMNSPTRYALEIRD